MCDLNLDSFDLREWNGTIRGKLVLKKPKGTIDITDIQFTRCHYYNYTAHKPLLQFTQLNNTSAAPVDFFDI